MLFPPVFPAAMNVGEQVAIGLRHVRRRGRFVFEECPLDEGIDAIIAGFETSRLRSVLTPMLHSLREFVAGFVGPVVPGTEDGVGLLRAIRQVILPATNNRKPRLAICLR